MKILLIYRGKLPENEMIPSVRLCGHAQLRELAKRGLFEYHAVNLFKLNDKLLSWADIVVIGRLDDNYTLSLAREIKKSGRRLWYILDDDLLNLPPENSNYAYYSMESTQSCIKEMLAMSEAMITPSPLLAGKYAGEDQQVIMVEEPAILPGKYRKKSGEGPIKLGFAGSIDRIQDLESLLKKVLYELKKKYGKRIEIEFFGAIPSFASELGAKTIPYCENYFKYRKTLNGLNWDIGLAPMPDTAFHACKHYNKFCEYSAAGIVGVYSDVAPYTRARDKFGVGLWVPNEPEEWIKAVSRLIDDAELLNGFKKKIYDEILDEIGVEKAASDMWEQIGELLNKKPAKYRPIKTFKRLKLAGYAERFKNAVKKYKFRLPLIVIKKFIEKCR